MRHLRYFLAVARELNFTRAAATLQMSVPPLSQRIKALEKDLGEPLFERSTHFTRLTPAGRALLPIAEKVVADFDAIPGRVRSTTRRVQVRVAIPDVLNPQHRRSIADSIDALEVQYSFTIRQIPSLKMEAELLSHNIDMAISHVGTTHPDLVATTLYTEQLGAVVDVSRFPGRQTLQISDLREMTYVGGPNHWDLRNDQSRWFTSAGIATDPDVRFSDTSGMLMLLRNANCFTVAPLESEAVAGLDRSEFAVLPIGDLNLTLTTWMIRRAADTQLDSITLGRDQ